MNGQGQGQAEEDIAVGKAHQRHVGDEKVAKKVAVFAEYHHLHTRYHDLLLHRPAGVAIQAGPVRPDARGIAAYQHQHLHTGYHDLHTGNHDLHTRYHDLPARYHDLLSNHPIRVDIRAGPNHPDAGYHHLHTGYHDLLSNHPTRVDIRAGLDHLDARFVAVYHNLQITSPALLHRQREIEKSGWTL